LSAQDTRLMKIEGYGQAKILTQEEIERLFSTGWETSRDRTLLGVCLYTACTAEACSLMVKDIYTNSGIVRSTISFAKANIMSDPSPTIQLPGRVCEIVRFWQILLVRGAPTGIRVIDRT